MQPDIYSTFSKLFKKLLATAIQADPEVAFPGGHMLRHTGMCCNFGSVFCPGVLSGKVGTGRYGPDRVPFWPPRFTNDPPFFLIGLDIGHILAKCFK